jgi:hypothetical protein
VYDALLTSSTWSSKSFSVSLMKEKKDDSAETRDDAEELELEDDNELVRVLDKEEKRDG